MRNAGPTHEASGSNIAQWQGVWDSEPATANQPTPSATGSGGLVNDKTSYGELDEAQYQGGQNRGTMMQQDDGGGPSVQNLSDIGSFLSPRTLWFDAYDSGALFPMVGSSMLEFASLEGDQAM